jgi:hypothetical protein
VETLILDIEKKGRLENALGAMSLEYEPTIVSEVFLYRLIGKSSDIANEIYGGNRTRSDYIV